MTQELKFEWKECPGLFEWLAERDLSLVVSGYHSRRIFLISSDDQGRPSIRDFVHPAPTGLAWNGSELLVASEHGIWLCRLDALKGLQAVRGWVTDQVKAHDLGWDSEGFPIFVNTRYSCLARPKSGGLQTIGFETIWKPPFISEVVNQDRCHLNGLATSQGRALYVTCLSSSDEEAGWRKERYQGGVLLDVSTNETVLSQLSLPHSPRIYRDQLWFHHSGHGQLARADVQAKTWEKIAFCPGILRGLDFVGDYAIAASSQLRYFGNEELPIEKYLSGQNSNGQCGIHIMNIVTGETEHSLLLEGVPELYDVRALVGWSRREFV